MALNFTKRISFVELQSGGGPIPGDPVEKVITKAWADIRTMRGSEVQTMIGDIVEIKTRFIIRYNKLVEKHHTLKYKNEKYKIESIMNDNEDNYTQTIIASRI